MTETEGGPTLSVYEAVGGEPFFVELVDHFYQGVEGDPLLRPMYPSGLDQARWSLAYFLVQYWGGPASYSEQRGHPRLRMRHAPFVIDQAARAAWMKHMSAAVDAMDPPAEIRSALMGYFTMAADHMVNAPG